MITQNWIEAVCERVAKEKAYCKVPEYGDIWNFEQHLACLIIEKENEIERLEAKLKEALKEAE